MLLGLLFLILPSLCHGQDTTTGKNPLYTQLNDFAKPESTVWEVWHYPLSFHDAEEIGRLIESKPEVQKVAIPFCQLSDTNSIPLIRALSQRSDLKIVDLRSNELCRGAMEQLALVTLNNPDLVDLNLSGNAFATDELADVIGNLKLNSNLRSLDLQGIPLSKKTVESLIVTLPTLTGLQNLNLTWTQLHPDLRSPLLRAISSLTKLKQLSLAYGDWAGLSPELTSIIKKCRTLEYLDLGQCNLTPITIMELQLAAQQPTKSLGFGLRKIRPSKPQPVLSF
jgi:Ran GTPase-activating protein (RanGAP) involved in mRNA processing and transport